MLAPPRLRAGKLLVDQRMYVETKYGQAFDVGVLDGDAGQIYVGQSGFLQVDVRERCTR